MSAIKKLIKEIHRRSLWQVLAIYVGGAWVGYEAIQGLTEGLGLPSWFPPFAIVLFIIGLPVVLATAFVQEGGPTAMADPQSSEGRLETDDSGAGSPTATRADGAPARTRSGGPAARRLLTWRNAIAGGVLAFALWGVIAAVWLILGRAGDRSEAGARTIDENRVAVLPFRVSGADPSLEYLQEGMVDLLAAKLTGEAGPQAIDPRSVISAWRRAVPGDDADLPQDSAVRLARRLGAGQVLLGGVVGTPTEVVLNAAVYGVPSGDVEARTSIRGSPDSLTALVDRLAATLLTLEAGEEDHRLANLTTRSLPALRAYLQGQSSYRRGRYEEAIEAFETALSLDSTFALAGLGLASSTGWFTGAPGQRGRALRLAWAHRDRLSERDRAELRARAGPRFPEPSSQAEQLDAYQSALEMSPDRAELWFRVGDRLFHYGAAMGLEDPLDRAESAFRQAMALDSSFVPPLQHLIQIVGARSDTSRVRRLGRLYLDRDSAGEAAEAVRWWMASTLGDTATLAGLRDRFDAMPTQNLYRIVQWGEFLGVQVSDAERASRVLVERAATPSARGRALGYRHAVLLNHGRPSEALQVADELAGVASVPIAGALIRTIDALYAEGDTGAARSAVRELEELSRAPLAEDTLRRYLQYAATALLERWRLLHGETGTARASIDRLRSAAREVGSRAEAEQIRVETLVLESILATQEDRAEADSLIERLDDILRTWPGPGNWIAENNLTVARLHAARGRPEKALEAIRRRRFMQGPGSYLSTFLREEGRLAALTGDREAAIRAYRHYLALRRDPEPAVADEVDRVRAELARLVGEDGS